MTSWLPDLAKDGKPRYLAIADAMARDIEAGRLEPGEKLPPQRDLAFDLGVTIGTIGRAYALAGQRGLIAGEVGRGTYVLERGPQASGSAPQMPAASRTTAPTPVPDPGLLRMDSTAASDVGQAAVLAGLAAEMARQTPHEVNDYVRELPFHWREAGSEWLSTPAWRPLPQHVVPAAGVHAAILAVIAATTVPGDRVAHEDLAYPATPRGTTLIGRRVVKVAIGPKGIAADDFESLCAQQHPKVLVTIPTLHNPTLATMPNDVRRDIAEIARRHNVWIIEDNIYGAALTDAPVNFIELAPERTFHLGGLSKSVSAGLRAAWVACPAGFAGAVYNAQRLMTGGLAYTMTELAARLVLSGKAEELCRKVRAEITAREAIARDILSGLTFNSHPDCPFLWLKLPEPWLPGTFKKAARARGILIDDADEFKIGQDERICYRVRIGFSSPAKRADVERGFTELRRLLDTAQVAYDSYE